MLDGIAREIRRRPQIELWELSLTADSRHGSLKRFEFAEQEPQQPFAIEPGLEQFLKDTSLSGDATEEEIEFLQGAEVQRKTAFPDLLLPGATKP